MINKKDDLRKQTNITDCRTIDYFEYYRAIAGTYRCHYRWTSRLSGIYRSDCRRRNVVQYHLLDLRIPTYGNKRHDLTSLRAA